MDIKNGIVFILSSNHTSGIIGEGMILTPQKYDFHTSVFTV